MPLHGVIFDVGRTLIWNNGDRFEAGNAWAAVNTLRNHGFGGDPQALWQDLLASRQGLIDEGADFCQLHTTAETLQAVATRHGFPLDQTLLDEAERSFVTPEACGSVLLPGMVEVLRRLAGTLPLAVVSNTRSHLLIENILLAKGISGSFDLVVTSTGCGWRKPSPRIFAEVLNAWTVPPETVVMVGDSAVKDIGGAKALGMRSIWLKSASRDAEAPGADATAELPADIPPILRSWGGAL